MLVLLIMFILFIEKYEMAPDCYTGKISCGAELNNVDVIQISKKLYSVKSFSWITNLLTSRSETEGLILVVEG